MFTIRKATTADIPVINKLAWEIFPETYKNILTKEQTEYMMEWMYSPENLHKQMEEEGHIYYIAYEECEPAGYVSIQQEGEHLFHLHVNRNNPALGFYKHMGMEKVREGDFPIGNGFYMNDYIMGIEL